MEEDRRGKERLDTPFALRNANRACRLFLRAPAQSRRPWRLAALHRRS
jgi:hypothetical protein